MAKIHFNVDIHSTAVVAESAVIGKPYRKLLGAVSSRASSGISYLGPRCSIGEYVIVGNDVKIGEDTVLDDFSKVEPGARIGRRCLLLYGAQVCANSIIGDDCIVGGLIGERAIIGDGCRVFGKVIHRQNNPDLGWDADSAEELSPDIRRYSFIGFQALVIGPVTIGPNSYVAAGAMVTKPVPPRIVVTGRNIHTPIEQWKGILAESAFFKR